MNFGFIYKADSEMIHKADSEMIASQDHNTLPFHTDGPVGYILAEDGVDWSERLSSFMSFFFWMPGFIISKILS